MGESVGERVRVGEMRYYGLLMYGWDIMDYLCMGGILGTVGL